MEQKKNYTLPIVMMFLLFAMISFVTGLSNPLGVIVKNQFAVANWMSQLGNFANFIAYAVMGIPAGMMLKRIGYKKTALAAVAVGFVGVGKVAAVEHLRQHRIGSRCLTGAVASRYDVEFRHVWHYRRGKYNH